MANYCGKSCEGCTYQEQLQCPGCAKGPGRTYGGDCEVASCCFSRKHDSCETCTGKNLCGKYRGRDKIPQWRIEKRKQVEAQRAYVRQKAPWCYRWFVVLFWVSIVSIVAELLYNENLFGAIPDIYFTGHVLSTVCAVIYGVALLLLSREEESYRKAGICYLIGKAPLLLSFFIQDDLGFMTVIGAIVSFVGLYFEYMSHSDILVNVDDELSERWRSLWKWRLGILIAGIAAVFVTIMPLIMVLLLFGIEIASVVVSILYLVRLHNTMKAFKDFV